MCGFPTSFRVRFRAVNGSRTRDLQLGKLPLYQLSYYRIGFQVLLKSGGKSTTFLLMRDTSVPNFPYETYFHINLRYGVIILSAFLWLLQKGGPK